MKKITIIAILIIISFFAFKKNPKSGPVILSGGSHIPQEAIDWMKNKVNDNYLIISCDIESSSKKWLKLLDKADFIGPEDLNEKHLSSVKAIIIDGGDQWEYLKKINRTILQKAHNNGILLFGNSAGSMILSDYIFTAEHGSVSSYEIEDCQEKIKIEKNTLNIKQLKGALVDTHFHQRDREKRLKYFLNNCDANYGIGIDEETALCFDSEGMSIKGKGSVKFLKP